MAKTATVKVDNKGRLLIPQEMRHELGLEPGATVFVESDGTVLRAARAENPFDALGKLAEQEFRADMTRSLREYVTEGQAAEESDEVMVGGERGTRRLKPARQIVRPSRAIRPEDVEAARSVAGAMRNLIDADALKARIRESGTSDRPPIRL